jgi:hypothetical protein
LPVLYDRQMAMIMKLPLKDDGMPELSPFEDLIAV